MRFFFTFFLLFNIHIVATAQTNNTEILQWHPDYKLNWDDFQGIPDTTSIGMAATVSGFNTKSSYTSDSSISVIVTAVFYKKKSWKKSSYQDVETLAHEQGHFDITEVFARKATAAFKEYKYTRSTVNKDIDSIVNAYFREMNDVEAQYDKETTYPINNKKQKEWENKIVGWLKKIPA